jgi:hypothetical protein
VRLPLPPIPEFYPESEVEPLRAEVAYVTEQLAARDATIAALTHERDAAQSYGEAQRLLRVKHDAACPARKRREE